MLQVRHGFLSARPKRARLMNSEKSDRPLDCWKEVELFKAEVAKVEQVSYLPPLRRV
jgi:hypothetical protein